MSSFFYKKRILIISPEPWGTSMVSKHHYALALAKHEAIVYFLNPPVNSKGYKVERVEQNIFTITYKPLLRGLNRLPKILVDLFLWIEINRLNKAWGNLDIVWSFDPFRFQNLNLFSAATRIYHAVDINKTRQEKRIAQTSDIVFTTSAVILNRFDSIDVPKYNIGHGLSEYFMRDISPDLIPEGSGKIKIGYVGNLQYKFLAKEVIRKIVSSFNELDFYFIGPYEESNLSGKQLNNDLIDFLKNQPNVFLLGPKRPDQLPGLMVNFDLFLLCYRSDTDMEELANPHKILEYLSVGRVVLSSYMDEYKDKSDLVEMEMIPDQLINRLSLIVSNISDYNGPEKVAARRNYAFSKSYSTQLKKIETYLTLL